jgi:hypothetical protein
MNRYIFFFLSLPPAASCHHEIAWKCWTVIGTEKPRMGILLHFGWFAATLDPSQMRVLDDGWSLSIQGSGSNMHDMTRDNR